MSAPFHNFPLNTLNRTKSTTTMMLQQTADTLTFTALLLSVSLQCNSFLIPQSQSSRLITSSSNNRSVVSLHEGTKSDEERTKETIRSNNPLELASWYAVEAFGKAFGSKKSDGDIIISSNDIDLTKQPSSLQETLARVKLDNDRSYFLSGEVDRLIYDEDCVFADPFVAFNGKNFVVWYECMYMMRTLSSFNLLLVTEGRDRFIDNLANLGSFITNYDAKMLKYDVEKDGQEIVTKVMVKLQLNLPWAPVLAWPWGVTYEVDPQTYLITSHVESWDIEAWEGVKQIFRKPTVTISNKKD